MKKLIVLRGAPGSGKSTFANSLIEKYEGIGKTVGISEADTFFTDPAKYPKRVMDLANVNSMCHKETRENLDKFDIAIAIGMNLFIKDVYEYEKIAYEKSAEMEVYRLDATFHNTHHIPEIEVKKLRLMMEPYEGEKVIDSEDSDVDSSSDNES